MVFGETPAQLRGVGRLRRKIENFLFLFETLKMQLRKWRVAMVQEGHGKSHGIGDSKPPTLHQFPCGQGK